jgi:hypothetical protein
LERGRRERFVEDGYNIERYASLFPRVSLSPRVLAEQIISKMGFIVLEGHTQRTLLKDWGME